MTSSSLSSTPQRRLAELGQDLPASLVVFLVALPLCLGIAHASNAPLLAGVVAAIVGGLLVSWLSGSELAVTGPAAGLAAVAVQGIETLGSFQAFCAATLIAGAMQLLFGVLRLGFVAYYFPSSVIRGLLAAIGVMLVLKELPHALGVDTDWIGDEALMQADGENTFSEVVRAVGRVHIGALVVAVSGLAILVAMDRLTVLRRVRRWFPAPLLVVTAGAGLDLLFRNYAPALALGADAGSRHLVSLPTSGPTELLASVRWPDFAGIGAWPTWSIALTIALVASLETLLSVEAIDRIDPQKRVTPPNRELVAQGIGNAVAGLVGGLPMTAVIVRGSANVQAGGRTKLSAFFHGVWFVVAVLALPAVLNTIPLAALAAVLLYVGYNLTRWTLWREMWRRGPDQFVPFAATVIAINLTDLLFGVVIGLGVAAFSVLRENYRTAYSVHERTDENGPDGSRRLRIQLAEHVSFLHKAAIRRVLEQLPRDVEVEIDGSASRHIDRDVLEIIHDFTANARKRGLRVLTTSVPKLELDVEPVH